jgi:hypothetical protein
MTKLGVLIAMEKYLEEVAGKSMAEEVMQGSEQITENTDKTTTALWVKNAIERLDASADEKTKMKVMQNCGCNCSKGFVEKYWEAILQKPAKVDLLRSAISGSKECTFAIHL